MVSTHSELRIRENNGTHGTQGKKPKPGISCMFTFNPTSNGGHRHLQIGRMLDIDLISEPPRPRPQMYVFKVWESVWPEGQEAIHSKLGTQDVTYLSLHPMPLLPRVLVKGRKSSVCPPLPIRCSSRGFSENRMQEQRRFFMQFHL